MTARQLRIAKKIMLVVAALPLMQGGCATFGSSALQSFANNAPATIFNSGLQLIVSILNGTSSFLFQSGGSFNGGFGS